MPLVDALDITSVHQMACVHVFHIYFEHLRDWRFGVTQIAAVGEEKNDETPTTTTLNVF